MKHWNERNDFLWLLIVFLILIMLTTPSTIFVSLALSGLGYLIGKLAGEVWTEEKILRKEKKSLENMH